MSFAQAFAAAFRREVAHVRRSGWDLALLFPLPLLAIVISAAIFSSGVLRDIPIALVDMDGSGLSRAITRALLADPTLKLTATPRDLRAAAPLLRSGRVYSLVYLPPGLERDARRGGGATAAIYYNSAIQTTGTKAAGAEQEAVQAAIARTVSPSHEGGPVRLNTPRIQTTIVGNPEQSFELFLQSLVTPLTLNTLLACAAVFAVGRELSAGGLEELEPGRRRALAARASGQARAPCPGDVGVDGVLDRLSGRPARLEGGKQPGHAPGGAARLSLLHRRHLRLVRSSVPQSRRRTVVGRIDLRFGYVVRRRHLAGEQRRAAFTRIWNEILPSTSYIRVQEEQWVLGSSALRSAPSIGLLLLFCVVALLIAAVRLKRLAARPPREEPLEAPPPPAGFLASLLQTLKVTATNKPILSTIVTSVVLYGFYYPMAYKVQTVVKLPVAVADLDRSPWSRAFLRKLDATREVRIVAQAYSAGGALELLRQDRVDAALVIPHGLEASLLKGSAGGLGVYLKGAYLVRVRFLGAAVSGAVRASLAEAAEPLRAAAHAAGPGARVLERPLYNVSDGYGGYVVPGVATIILQATLLFGVAMFMGLRRERDTWRMTPAAFLGMWAAFTLLGSLNCLFWFGFVFWMQDYPRAGNIPGMLLGVPIFSAAVSAMALLVGSLFERHERSMQILAGTSVPFFFVAGLSWPAIAMPPLVVAFAKLVPSTTAVLMFVKLNSQGAPIPEVATDMAVLAVLAAIYGAAAMLRISDQPAARRQSSRATWTSRGPSYGLRPCQTCRLSRIMTSPFRQGQLKVAASMQAMSARNSSSVSVSPSPKKVPLGCAWPRRESSTACWFAPWTMSFGL